MATWKTFTRALAHPVTLADGKIVGAVTLREPDVDALEAIDALNIDPTKDRPTVKQVRGIITVLSDQTPEVIGRLHRDDFSALGEAVAPLLLGEME